MDKIKKTDMLKVPVDQVDVEEGFNVREDYGDIETLAKQIAAQGQKQPIKAVRNGNRVTLTAGHRRLQAIKMANKKFGANIEYVLTITEKAKEEDRVFEMLIDGDGSKPLSNKEMVKGIKRLLDMGVAQKEIVSQLGMSKSQAQAYNLVAAANAPDPVQKLVDEGLISMAGLNEAQRQEKDDKKLEKLVKEAIKDAESKGKSTATGSNVKAVVNKDEPKEKKAKKTSSDVEKLEAALEIAEPQTAAKKATYATVQAIVAKLKSGASAESIAKLLK